MVAAQKRQLTPRQQRFVAEYLARGNASEAYRRAYPGSDRWTQNALKVQASKSLHLPNVAAAIAEIQESSMRATIATVVERKELLTKVIRALGPGPYPAHIVIAAIDLLNRMDNLYISRQESRNLNVNADVDKVLDGYTVDELNLMLQAMRDGKAASRQLPAAQGISPG